MKFGSMVKNTLLSAMALLSASAFAEPQSSEVELKSSSLENLLQQVQAFSKDEDQLNQQRQSKFLSAKQDQQALLQAAIKELASEEKIAQSLKDSFDENEEKLTEKAEELRQRVGNLGEMFGVVRQVSDDLNGLLHNSLTIVEKPQRGADLDKLSQAKELPNIQELKDLWFVLQEEMTMSGQVATFEAPVIQLDGSEKTEVVTRIGVFNAVNQQGYLRFDEQTGRLIAMTKQPAESGYVEDYLQADETTSLLAIDPTRGALLGLVLSNPDLIGRIQQGALVGYIIIVLAVIGLLLAAWRLLVLMSVRKKVELQIQNTAQPSDDNPLGRVLLAGNDNSSNLHDQENLELKIDEAILKEVPQLEKAQSMIKLFAGIAPLLGLLGTVTGMIATFQAITNFGTGDPKLMAGGISQALITTVLGLVAAIPLLLSHNVVSSQSKRLIQILDEQAAGLIAKTMERRNTQD